MEKDKKYKRIGWITTVTVQLLMLLLFYFLIAWKEPFPPIPTYGIELNFGFTEAGSGEEPIEEIEQTQPLESETEEITEEPNEIQDEVVEQVDEVVEEVITPIEEAEPIVEEVFVDQTSPVVINETPAEKKPEIKMEEPNKVEEAKPVETKKEDPVVAPVNQEALMPTTDNGTKTSSQGTTGTTGDEGKEEGTLDGRALYGSQGSSDGASLAMAGWSWDEKPKPDDKSIETGKIVYKITVDSEGYLIGIDVDYSTISPEIERVYRQSVERLIFNKTNDYKPAPTSTGFVTFIIKNK